MGNGSSGQVHPSGPEGAPEGPLRPEEQVELEFDGPPRAPFGNMAAGSPGGRPGSARGLSSDLLAQDEENELQQKVLVVRRVPVQCADLISNAMQLALKEAGDDLARTRPRWVLVPGGGWKTVGTMSNSKKIDLRDEVRSAFQLTPVKFSANTKV